MRNSRPTPSVPWASPDGVEVLATGTSTPDQLLPNHAVMVHGELGWPRLEAVACAGICLSGIAALKHAWMSIATGSASKAVACASELVSPMMRGHRFEAEVQHKLQALEQRPEIAFEKDFLALDAVRRRSRVDVAGHARRRPVFAHRLDLAVFCGP